MRNKDLLVTLDQIKDDFFFFLGLLFTRPDPPVVKTEFNYFEIENTHSHPECELDIPDIYNSDGHFIDGTEHYEGDNDVDGYYHENLDI